MAPALGSPARAIAPAHGLPSAVPNFPFSLTSELARLAPGLFLWLEEFCSGSVESGERRPSSSQRLRDTESRAVETDDTRATSEGNESWLDKQQRNSMTGN